MNISRQILRNTTAGWFEMAISLISALIIPPLLIARLGKESYGVWLLVGQVIAYLAILDLGVSSSVGRFVAKYNAKNDSMGTSRIISSSIFLFIVSAILIILATLILWPNFSRFFHLSDKYINTGKWLIIITGLGVALNFPLRIGQGILEGFHDFHLLYFIRALGSLVKMLLIGLFFGLLRYNNLLLLALITLAATTVPNLFMCRAGYNKLPNLSLDFKQIKLSNLREIWSLSTSALLCTIASLLFNQGQVIFIGKLAGVREVTIYAIPVMLLTYGSMILAYIVGAFNPLASHMQALTMKEQLQNLNIKGTHILFIFSLFIAVISIAFGESFLRIWLSSSDLQTQDFTRMNFILTIMVTGFAIGAPQFATEKILAGTNKHGLVAVVSFAASLIGLFVGILLMTKTDMGLYGMAIGWAIVFFIKGVLIFPISACKHFDIKLSDYIRKAYVPPMGPAIILTVTAFSIRYFWDVTTLALLMCSILLCSAVYITAVYFICFDPEQKVIIWNMISKFKT